MEERWRRRRAVFLPVKLVNLLSSRLKLVKMPLPMLATNVREKAVTAARFKLWPLLKLYEIRMLSGRRRRERGGKCYELHFMSIR